MLKKVSDKLSQYPGIYTLLRKGIEFNFRTQKKIISEEFGENSGLVLDLPSGVGEFSVFFDKENYVGVDLDENYVEYGKKKYGKKLVVGDAMALPFGEGYFDGALVSGFFHHLGFAEVERSLLETSRVLKDGGKMLLIEDSPGSSFVTKKLQKYDVGANIRPMEDYISVLEKHFEIEKKYPVKSGFWTYSVFVCKKKSFEL